MSCEDCEPTTALVIQAMCCVVAADARVSGSEIDVVFDTLAAIGHRATREQFRDKVIATCQDIHRKGVLTVVESLCQPLAALKGKPLAVLMLQLQEDVMHSDGTVTEAEKTVVARFRQVLSANPTDAAKNTATQTLNGDASRGQEPLQLKYRLGERFLSWVLWSRRLVDSWVGSRLLVVVLSGLVVGLSALLATGSVASASLFAVLGWLIPSCVLCLGADKYLVQTVEVAPRERAFDEALEGQALRLIAALDVPSAVPVDESEAVESGASVVATDSEQDDQKGFDTALALVRHPTWSIPHRAKIARRLYGLLRGSREPGGGRSACRCTACRRKYWFRVNAHGVAVICPYCGGFQRATLDWKVPRLAPTRPVSAITTFRQYLGQTSVPNFSGGPVSVRGYVNRRGTWVQSHTRSRPRRLRW